jgi:hypothetical protein
MALAGITPAVYVLALACLSVGRFLAAAIGASQPHVVTAEALLTANSVAPTMGTVASGVGALAGFGVAMVAGEANRWTVIVFSAALFALAAGAARGFGPSALGPDAPTASFGEALRSLMSGLAGGTRYVIRQRSPALAIGAVGVSRLGYGLVFMAAILISRHRLAPPGDADAGLAVFATILACAGAGFALAAVVTPLAQGRFSPAAWITVCLAGAGVTQLALDLSAARAIVYGAALLLSAAIQGIKIAADTLVQRDVADIYRGRAFALYDVAFNLGFLLAAGLAALALPDDGHSFPLFAVLAAGYGLAGTAFAAGFSAATRTAPPRS